MFAKFQLSDTNYLHIFNSTKATPPSVGLSITPPVKKFNEQIKGNPHKKFLACPNDGKIDKKNSFVKKPVGKIEKNDIFSGNVRTQVAVFNSNNLASTRIPDAEIQRMGKFGENSISGGCINGAVEEVYTHDYSQVNGGKNNVLKKEEVTIKIPVKNYDGSDRKNRGKVSNGVVVKMQARCLKKWSRYGGCMPAMLEAVESIDDLDDALRPWEMNLSNKERSILLKEQIKWERAVEIFEWFKRKGCYEVNVIHYNIMFRILGKARQWCEVERLWVEMGEKKIEPINSTYGTLIDVYSKGGLVEEAMKWLELMNKSKMDPDEITMGTVVQMYKKVGNFEMAEEFYKKWSFRKSLIEERTSFKSRGGNGNSLSTYTYNTLIDTYGKAGKLQSAIDTFERMLKKEIIPTTVTFNTMIHMYGNNGQLGKVSQLMQKMESSVHCSPDTRTYNILISLHAKNDNIDMAVKYLKKMKDNSLEPDAVTYRTLLYAFSIRQMVFESEELVKEMDEKGFKIDEFTQSSLTRMYIEANLLDRAWSWFERFHFRGDMTSECYSANIDAFGERGHVWLAEKVFNCCEKLSVLEFNVMIKGYGISKNYEKACSLFDSMAKHGVIPDKCSYNSLVQMLASADLTHKARHYLRKMQEAGLVIDCVPYCAVISSYSKLGKADMAVELYDEMIYNGIKPDIIVYGVLINAFADMGCVKEARKYVNAMSDFGFSMNDVICKSLIKLYTKVGFLKEAREVYSILGNIEPVIDIYSSNCMIDLYSERSMILEAENIFKKLTLKGVGNEFTYAMMLRMYRRSGLFVEAFGIARKMRELGLMSDLLSYNNVIGLYASDGRFQEAAATFDEMMTCGVRPDECTFKSLGIILLKCGVPKSAIEKLERTRMKYDDSGIREWSSILCTVTGMNEDDE